MLFGDPKTDNELRPNWTVKEGAEYVEEWTCPKKRYKSLGDDLSLIVVHRDSFYQARQRTSGTAGGRPSSGKDHQDDPTDRNRDAAHERCPDRLAFQKKPA
jgi:hypothetical protein